MKAYNMNSIFFDLKFVKRSLLENPGGAVQRWRRIVEIRGIPRREPESTIGIKVADEILVGVLDDGGPRSTVDKILHRGSIRLRQDVNREEEETEESAREKGFHENGGFRSNGFTFELPLKTRGIAEKRGEEMNKSTVERPC